MASAPCAVSLDNTLADTFRVAPIMAKLAKIGLAAPALELGTSVSTTIRDLLYRVSETGLTTKDQVHGLAPKPKAMGLLARMSSEVKATMVKQSLDLHYGTYRERMKLTGETPMKE